MQQLTYWSTWGQSVLQIFISLWSTVRRKQCKSYNYLNKMSLIVMKRLYPVNCFFVLISRNKEIKKIISVSRAGDLCSLLTVILAHSQPLYRSWNTVLLLAVFVLISIKLPIYWALPVSTGLLYPGPDGDQSCTHELLLFSQADNSFQITNKPTILGYK